jgi:hypothetical protein
VSARAEATLGLVNICSVLDSRARRKSATVFASCVVTQFRPFAWFSITNKKAAMSSVQGNGSSH